MSKQTATVERKTGETDIKLTLNFSERSPIDIRTGVPFLDHMLHAMSHHGGFSLMVEAMGDVHIDQHHLVEDVGLVLGDALKIIRESGAAITRFGHAVIPMDEALSETTIDICNRSYLVFRGEFPQEYCGEFHVVLVREFLQALANRAAMNLHAELRYGLNSHHMCEALFKSLGRSLAQAYSPRPQDQNPAMSTKGIL